MLILPNLPREVQLVVDVRRNARNAVVDGAVDIEAVLVGIDGIRQEVHYVVEPDLLSWARILSPVRRRWSV